MHSSSKLNHHHQRYAEAAMCNVHTSAMIAEYLGLAARQRGQPLHGIPASAQAFTLVSPNTKEEVAPAGFNVDNLQDSTVFTKSHLIKTMGGAIDLLTHEQAKLYETANEMYKLLIPIYESDFNYKELRECHASLQEVFEKIIESVRTAIRNAMPAACSLQ